MADCMDIDARRDISKLYTAHEKLATVVWGANGENGINSRVKELSANHEELAEKVNELEVWGHNIWEVQRPANCLGIEAVRELREELETEKKERKHEMSEMRKSRFAMYSALGVALITTFGPPIIKLIGG